MPKHPWGGRFKEEIADLMLMFSESVSFDHLLAEVDIQGSIAHARMLAKCGIISELEGRRLVQALEELLEQAEKNELPLRMELEDIHMNVEALLREKIGDLADKLHTGRSRNDQVATDLRLFFYERAILTYTSLTLLIMNLLEQAEQNLSAIMPGFTHTRKAQPVLFSHHLMAYVEMFFRDRERFLNCAHRMNYCPLGSGALAGTTFPLDREMVARELGFSEPTANSIDAVSDRDFLLEFAADASMTMIHLSRLMEELIWWGLPELGFVELPQSFCTGSSMMPNKQNPDAAELIRGKTGRVLGALVGLFTVMKGTPLAYNRDFQEDKEGMFDLTETLAKCILIASHLVADLQVNPQRMREACQTGFLLATDLADYLVTKGLPFRQAHHVVGEMVKFCEENHKRFEDLELHEMKKFSPLFGEDVKGWLSLEASVQRRNLYGGTAPEQVKRRIQERKEDLAEDNLFQKILGELGAGRYASPSPKKKPRRQKPKEKGPEKKE